MTDKRIELRSEKVRRIVGTIPPALVRWNITVLIVILFVLIAVVCCIPYPYGEGESILRHILGCL
ncbi:hypothetical protein H9625_04230 [Phocaeicola sp. Sa1CVN1]|uniref:Uncharacterized protein n=1 Tax=Phocaeicola intestinalis TaxID=2762212 RepID=A0ABR8Y622_9BACT|nr:hypothetical protein [Phocaeicola intestinalis]MBD8039661.1 hypothetical protein [Phocaeicola intestinalis]